MKEIYNSDRPISSQAEDKFKRYNFSKRIAETIINRKSNDGLVIGIYGAWGEGKTSVLNILEKELEIDSNIIVIKFNPWRFTNEETLVLNFFKNISEALDRQLNNLKEKIGLFVKKYGSATSVFNLDLSNIGESLSDTDLEELKNRVNDFLKESNKKVVIVIDDIDRLDKQELFAIFKLVKLTGDFSNTYYLLSFDDEMVASAIGERYANGDKISGYNFLEKIIQVPLRIPKALSSSLLHYTYELLNEVINESGIVLSESESQHIGYLISQNILPRIITPRLAVRYANSLSFLLPLLKGEVNHSDLILFEAVKIYFPKHYDFIKNNPHFFIDSYKSFGGNTNTTKVEEFKSYFNDLNSDISKIEVTAITNLLIDLFPRINEVLRNSYVHEGEAKWVKEKKIGSAKYFNRYFLYSVPDNQISDVYFSNFIESISSQTIDELSMELTEILSQIDGLEFFNKFSFYEETFDIETNLKAIKLINHNEANFPEIRNTFSFGMVNPKSQAAITICRLIKNISNKEQQIEIAKDLLYTNTPFDFSVEILRWLKVGKTDNDKIFDESVYKEFNEIILNRALKDCIEKDITIFETYENYIFSLLSYWFEKDSEELLNYVNKLLEKNPAFIKTIVFALTKSIYSSSNPNLYKIDFEKESFELIKKYFDVGLFYKCLILVYNDELEGVEVKFYGTNEGQTEINALRQFKHWFESENKDTEYK